MPLVFRNLLLIVIMVVASYDIKKDKTVSYRLRWADTSHTSSLSFSY